MLLLIHCAAPMSQKHGTEPLSATDTSKRRQHSHLVTRERVPNYSHPFGEESPTFSVQRVLHPSGDCPNWQAALDQAKSAAGCPGVPASPSASACKKRLPCNICMILADDAWPTAFIVEFPGKSLTAKGATNWVPADGTSPDATYGRPHRDTPGTIPSGWMELKQALCHGQPNVAELAHAIFHESLHFCKAYGAYGPTTVDLPDWDPRDDADAVTRKCGL